MDRPDGFSPRKKKSQGQAPRAKRQGSSVAVQRATSRRRKKAEKSEYQRFTQATRHRRMVWGVSMGSIGLLILGVVVLTLSPALALRQVVVEGSNRIETSQIEQALGHMYGEPLARVSSDRIAEALEPLTLIQAFTTRIEPPNTLVVSIVEREPLGVVSTPAGFVVVDGAGVSLWTTPDRPDDLPRITSSPQSNLASFLAATRVLAALPSEVVGQVDSVSASTLDDVRFTMRDIEHEVIWGSSERASEKAKVLQASLIAAGVGDAKVIDVTTPDSVVIREKD